MKPILIDRLVKETQTESEFQVILMGQRLRGWKIAKPLNHNFTWIQRIQLALYILKGKAIAVQYFEDLSDKDKEEHVRNNLKK